MMSKISRPRASAKRQLAAILSGLPPSMEKLTRGVLPKLRAQLPGAVEMVYDKKNSLVIGFCSDERASTVISSIAVHRNWINLYFFEGDTLPDPEGLLQGSGSTVRSIRLTAADTLDAPAVKALIAEARKRARPPLDPRAKGHVILRQTRKS